MITFDQTLVVVGEVLKSYESFLSSSGPVVVNRDLNGRIRLVFNEEIRGDDENIIRIEEIADELSTRLGVHGVQSKEMVLFESDVSAIALGAPCFPLDGFFNVTVVDRLATATDWASIAPVTEGVPRIVFFSIKGGVGRSTALSVAAWSLAQSGKRVLVVDLDLESPGLSSSLLQNERRPVYGIADWLVEDLVSNGLSVFEEMVATSDLSYDGEIFVVPAHGRIPGDYVSKLGRVWMSKVTADGIQETWSKRLNRLLGELESRWRPDVILIDSRAGIDEVASACVTQLGATGILLFALDGEQTWSGYRILFNHWHRAGVVRDIRDRLQLIGAMIPEVDGADYFDGLRERAWNTFSEGLYDEVPPGETTSEHFSFDESDVTAPHYPLPIRWHRGFASLLSIHSHFQRIDESEVTSNYGAFVEGVAAIADVGRGV